MDAKPKQGMNRTGSTGKFAQTDTTQCNYTCEDAIAEIERETNVRMKCYDRWVAEGRMTDEEASTRMGGLVSAWHFLSDTDAGRAMLLAKVRKDQPF